MTTVFADTSYYLALGNQQDESHRRAVEALEGGSLRVVTSAGYCLRSAMGSATPGFGEGLPGSSMRSAAIGLYNERRDKEWSLTDCTSFVIMRRRKLHRALTADHHFVQAGFEAMLG